MARLHIAWRGTVRQGIAWHGYIEIEEKFMRVKIFRSEAIKEVESDINSFLSDRKDIKVIDIREVDSRTFYIFMILYERVN